MRDRRPARRRLPEDVRRALKRPAHTTIWLVASLVGVFMLQLKADALTSVLAMIRLGANVPALVYEGEWWRLISANFLHGSVLHIAFNGWALWVLGGLLERMLDGRRLLLLYLVSAVGGALASTVFSGALLAVGASTAVFGLLGGLGAVQWRLGDRMPQAFRQSRRWWWLVLGINGAISFLVPNIDAAAHVGGFVAGGAVGLVLVGSRRPLMGTSDHPGVLAGAVAMLLVFGFGLGQAYLGAKDFDDAASARALRAVAAHAEAPAEILNELAWDLALDERSGRVTLEAAEATAQAAVARAVEDGSPSDHVRDTLATVQARLGQPEAAGATELAALVEQPRAFYATQLARFLKGAPKPAWAEAAPQARPGGQRVIVGAGRPDAPTALVARVHRRRSPAGVWIGVLTADSPAAMLRATGAPSLPDDVRLEVLGALPAPEGWITPGRWRWWRDDPEALRLDDLAVVGPSAALGGGG